MAALIGGLILAHVLDTLVSVGSAVWIAAGLYVILRERIAAKQLSLTKTEPAQSTA